MQANDIKTTTLLLKAVSENRVTLEVALAYLAAGLSAEQLALVLAAHKPAAKPAAPTTNPFPLSPIPQIFGPARWPFTPNSPWPYSAPFPGVPIMYNPLQPLTVGGRGVADCPVMT